VDTCIAVIAVVVVQRQGWLVREYTAKEYIAKQTYISLPGSGSESILIGVGPRPHRWFIPGVAGTVIINIVAHLGRARMHPSSLVVTIISHIGTI
jgi:hypothetical protein